MPNTHMLTISWALLLDTVKPGGAEEGVLFRGYYVRKVRTEGRAAIQVLTP